MSNLKSDFLKKRLESLQEIVTKGEKELEAQLEAEKKEASKK